MKKLIFCFDGTCNSPQDSDDFFEDSSISNIVKLHAFLGGKLNPMNSENETLSDQHSFYYSGVGTRGNWLKRKFNALFAPPYGDMDDILDEARADLKANFCEGDDIYIFGFSRGAAIARMFAAHLPYKVKFLGVFDTVAATRGSLDLNPDTFPVSGIVFENGTLGSHVEQAVHLLSLDEKRILGLKENKTDEDRKRLATLNEALGRLDFSKSARDPLYLEFVKAIPLPHREI